jgi:hypothetical protein
MMPPGGPYWTPVQLRYSRNGRTTDTSRDLFTLRESFTIQWSESYRMAVRKARFKREPFLQHSRCIDYGEFHAKVLVILSSDRPACKPSVVMASTDSLGNTQQNKGDKTKVVPFLVEDELKRLGAIFEKVPILAALFHR